MNHKTNLGSVPAIDDELFEQAWRLAFGARTERRLTLPVHEPFLAAMRKWHGTLEGLGVMASERSAYDRCFIALAVHECRGDSDPCCVSSGAVRWAARRPPDAE